MSDSIATVGSVAVVAGSGPPRPPLPGERPRTAPAGNSGTPSVPETRAVAHQAAQTQGRYQVRIHAETMRMITEIVDMITGDVLMYLPAGYRPDAKPVDPESTGADT